MFSGILPPKTKAHVKIYKKPHFNEMLNEKAVKLMNKLNLMIACYLLFFITFAP